MQQLIGNNRSFFIPLIIYLLVGLILLLLKTPEELFFSIYEWRHAPLLKFHKLYTYVGDGIFCVVVALILFFSRIRYGIMMITGFALSGLTVTFLKRVVFPDRHRPWGEWKDTGRFVDEGIEFFSNNSFPSGHTTTAFFMFTLLALIWGNKQFGWFMFLLALLVGYSRIYLAQHHFVDVYAGSALGVLSAIIVYFYFVSPSRKFNRQPGWMDRPLHRLRQ